MELKAANLQLLLLINEFKEKKNADTTKFIGDKRILFAKNNIKMAVIYCNEDFYPELNMFRYNIALHDHSI